MILDVFSRVINKFGHLWAGFLIFVGLCLNGCGADVGSQTISDEIAVDSDGTSQVLTKALNDVILPEYQRFLNAAQDMQVKQQAYCNGLGTANENTSLFQAREQWHTLMDSAQALALFDFAVASEKGDGELTYLERIYFYEFNMCQMDLAMIGSQSDDFDFKDVGIKARGMQALERALFDTDTLQQCALADIARGWNDLPEAERKLKRCEYGVLVAKDIVQASEEIHNTWNDDNGSYKSVYLTPSNAKKGSQDLFTAQFFLEEVKDFKLCLFNEDNRCIFSGKSGTLEIESMFSNRTYDNIIQNLTTAKHIFAGADDDRSDTFYELLDEKGALKSADSFIADLDSAVALLETRSSSLAEDMKALTALQNEETSAGATSTSCINASADPDTSTASNFEICRIHGYVKRAVDVLKADIKETLNLDIPATVQGDGD